MQCFYFQRIFQGQGRKGQVQMSQGPMSKVVGQSHIIKVKVFDGSFLPHRLAEGATRGHFHS